MSAGYYRFPTIHQDTIIFVSEDDLWSVPAEGGVARRLTSNQGEVTYPMLSPNGEWVAFVGREEGGPEIYVMEAEGGSERRLTYLNSNCQVVGWTADGERIIFSSTHEQMDRSEMGLFTVDVASPSNEVRPLPYGPARSVAFGPNGEVVLGRNTGDPARWKRYRGGTAGHLWIDNNGDGEFQRFLPDVAGNIASPMWLSVAGESRIYFVSDHEGIGNLYSCLPDATDIRRHTDHESYYVRNPSTDGHSIVYHLGADLVVFDVAAERESRVEVRYRSPRIQRNRKFVDAGRYMDGYDLHPSGLAVAITSRGKPFAFYNHEGAVIQYGKRDGVRYRRPEWLSDGRRFVVITDATGEESLEIFGPEPYAESMRLDNLDLGRVVDLKASPVESKIAITNHRYELLLVDLETHETILVDRSRFRNIAGFDWSPDGRWLAYSLGATSQTSEIRLYRLLEPDAGAGEADREGNAEGGALGDDAAAITDDGGGASVDAEPNAEPNAEADALPEPAQDTLEVDSSEKDTASGATTEPDTSRIYTVTEPVLHDVQPAFDPQGKYLYFLSYREFNPVYDALHFDLGFPWGMRPYLLTLRKDLSNPFIPQPDFEGVEAEAEEDDGEDGESEESNEDDNGEDVFDEDDTGDAEEDEGLDDAADDEPDDEFDDQFDGEIDGDLRFGFLDRRSRLRRPRSRRGRKRGRAIQVAFEADVPGPEEAGAADEQTQGARVEGGDAGKVPGDVEQAVNNGKSANGKGKRNGTRPLRIDLEGIEQRIVAFPVPDANYGQIAGIPGKAIFTVFPVSGQLDNDYDWDDEEPETGQLRAYDFKDYKNELLAERVTSFDLSANRKKLIYAGAGNQLRVIAAGEKAPGGGPPRKSGWVPLHRVKVSVDPQTEWEQMFREAWRLQRDHFWTEDMSKVDWQAVFTRYFDLIPRVSTRSELSDLLWEMQGELGTSHAYEFGGDYRPRPYYGQGFLGAEFRWDAEQYGYRVENILRGDPWIPQANSPLLIPGADVRVGDVLININGQMLDEEFGPGRLLVNQARHEVLLVFKRPQDLSRDIEDGNAQAPNAGEQSEASEDAERVETLQEVSSASKSASTPASTSTHSNSNGKARYISVVTRTLSGEIPARYRQWVNDNRRRVHQASGGRIGYVHIPDMGATGYAEFHRGYLAEVDRDGLIVDVRYNGGGHVSQLILEKLARRRIGYDLSRWGGLIPYPMESIAGPLVALTNEHAGSDGDIFCHSFKLMGLGPLVGKRTWGGVIGIAPTHALVDGTVTTQPEYSFWFEDVGWNVENYGTEPDIEMDNRPQDHVSGVDAQLERAIAEAMRLLEENPIRRPPLDERPSRALPKLPPRTTAQGESARDDS